MTPTEYLRKRNIILKGATDLIIGFDLTACELDKYYYDAAMKRLEQHQQQLTMF